MTRERYQTLSAASLKDLAKTRGIKGSYAMKKEQLIEAMLALDAKEAAAASEEPKAEPEKTKAKTKETQKEKPVRKRIVRRVKAAQPEEGRQAEAEKPPVQKAAADSVQEIREQKISEGSAVKEPEPEKGTKKKRVRIVRKSEAPREEQKEEAQPQKEAQPLKEAQPEAEIHVDQEPDSEAGPEAHHKKGSYPYDKEGEKVRGILEVMQDGFGFIRSDNFLPGDNDIYVSPSQIRRFNLKTGDMICGLTRQRAQGEKFGALLYVESVNGFPAEKARERMVFEQMTPVFPYERIRLERPGGTTSSRIVDMICPIGKGQRGMIVSPPKAGKTTLLKDIAKSILFKDPDANLLILLIDERPEEVTDMKESVHGSNVEIIYSTFDELPEHHKRVSEMVIEWAKRLVEHKQDVVILLDSITRLARAYNVLVPQSGRTLSGGLDPTALHMPKRFFGAARKMREGGSLTILATALVDTGSKMDDVVYEEFKGTGNMELILDRKLQERRIFPAIDIAKSSTRREDLLLSPDELEAVNIMRRSLNGVRSEEATEAILNMFSRLKSNQLVVQAILQRKLF